MALSPMVVSIAVFIVLLLVLGVGWLIAGDTDAIVAKFAG